MTKKDYEKIAQAFNDTHPSNFDSFPGGPEQMWDMLRQAISGVLITDNPKFDILRFNHACRGQHD